MSDAFREVFKKKVRGVRAEISTRNKPPVKKRDPPKASTKNTTSKKNGEANHYVPPPARRKPPSRPPQRHPPSYRWRPPRRNDPPNLLIGGPSKPRVVVVRPMHPAGPPPPMPHHGGPPAPGLPLGPAHMDPYRPKPYVHMAPPPTGPPRMPDRQDDRPTRVVYVRERRDETRGLRKVYVVRRPKDPGRRRSDSPGRSNAPWPQYIAEPKNGSEYSTTVLRRPPPQPGHHDFSRSYRASDPPSGTRVIFQDDGMDDDPWPEISPQGSPERGPVEIIEEYVEEAPWPLDGRKATWEEDQDLNYSGHRNTQYASFSE